MSIVEISQVLLTPTIAVIAVYIAYQQYALARHKSDVGIYDRRLKIYRATVKLLRSVEYNSLLSSKDYHEWELLIFEAELLFDNVVLEHLNKLSELAGTLAYLGDLVKKPEIEQNQNKLDIERTQVFNELIGLTRTTMTVFEPYFNILKERHKVKQARSYSQIIKDEEEVLDNQLKAIGKKSLGDDDILF